MSDYSDWIHEGQVLGYEGRELREFVEERKRANQEKLDRERAERALDRAEKAAERAAAAEKEKADRAAAAEKEKADRAERAAERAAAAEKDKADRAAAAEKEKAAAEKEKADRAAAAEKEKAAAEKEKADRAAAAEKEKAAAEKEKAERAAAAEKEKADRAATAEREKAAAEKERADRAAEKERAERELEIKRLEIESRRMEVEAQIEMKKIEAEREVRTREIEARLATEARLSENRSPHDSNSQEGHREPGFKDFKVPIFKEEKDDLDAWIIRFERKCEACNVEREQWATLMSGFLEGKALDVYQRLSNEEARDYDALKVNLLKRFQLTESGYRKRFRGCRIESGETHTQFAERLGKYLDKWREMAGYAATYEELRRLIIKDQFFNTCTNDMRIFIKERGKMDLPEMTRCAEDYTEAHGHERRPIDRPKEMNGGYNKPALTRHLYGGQPPVNKLSENVNREKRQLECEICGGRNHRSINCSKRTSINKPIRKKCFKCGSESHLIANCDSGKETIPHKIAAVQQCGSNGEEQMWQTRHWNNTAEHDLQPRRCQTNECQAAVKLVCGCVLPVVDTKRALRVCQLQSNENEPFMGHGYVNGKKVQVLRDTGAMCCVVKASLVRPEQYTGFEEMCILIDGGKKYCRTAIIDVQTEFFSGKVKALVMENPSYECLIGNVKGARITPVQLDIVATEQHEPEDKIKEIREECEEEPITLNALNSTRASREPKPMTSLVTRELGDIAIQPEEIARMQKEDTTLEVYRKIISKGKGDIGPRKNGFVEKHGILYRQYRASKGGTIKLQLVVPINLREKVMTVAHCSLLSSHMGVKKTTEKVTSEFYWPGIYQDVRRFVLSCDLCQRTMSKGCIRRAKLGSLPLVDTPFSRINVDIIGPVQPVSGRGHRYILTIIDACTRYPEAIPLRGIGAEEVTEALFGLYCRMGIPKEIHSDRGGQFTSELMREVNEMLKMRHTLSTPYHPMSNGCIENLNGTIKVLLKKMIVEKPKDWDRYLPPLLFALRDTPHESHGFTPFELMFGRSARGPMSILRDLWTKENTETEVKQTYQYVLELRERIENTCEMAQVEIAKMQDRNKFYYNRKARERKLEIGDKVLLLLPTNNNKLLLQWRGPFEVCGKVGEHDYRLMMGNGKIKTFHINMLKKYLERDGENEVAKSGEARNVVAVVATVIEDGEEGGGSGNEEELLQLCNCKQTETYQDVNIDPRLSEDQKAELRELVQEYADIFSDVPGRTNLVEHEIKLTQDEPIRCKAYPTPYALQKEIDKEIKNMLDMDIIERSDSPYAAPLVVVKKTDGTNRMCCNFQKLNKATIFDPEPMMAADDVFQKLNGSRVYSKFDFCKGYWQIPMHEESKDKTAFICANGLYRFKVMPYGLVNSASSYNRLIRKLLEDTSGLESYVDDILAHSEGWKDHLKVLREFFERVRQANLTLKPKKCYLGFEQVDFLGHTLSKDTIYPREDAVNKIMEMPRPTTKKQVRSFLGAINFYRKFIPKCAELAASLSNLTKKGASNVVKWNDTIEQSFMELKKALSSKSVLLIPNLEKRFIVQTDASDCGIGGVLMQEHDGTRHPVAFASRKLSDREKKYSVGEKECLAIIWGIQKFHRFLYGREFTLETDHCGLQYLKTMSPENPRIMRWSLILQTYHFVVKYIKGESNVIADCLSRVCE